MSPPLRLALGLLLSTALLGSFAPEVLSQTLTVARKTRLRAEASTNSQPLRVLQKGERLALLAPAHAGGYLHVRHASALDGWVWRSHVRRLTETVSIGRELHSEDRSSVLPEPSGLATAGAGPGLLEVHVIDVGQADAILLRCPDGEHEMLIDSGDNRYVGSAKAFRDYIDRFQDEDNEIEVVVASHPHADHIGSMAWLLRNRGVGMYVDNGNEYHTRTYERVDDAWDQSTAGYWSAQEQEPPNLDFCPLAELDAQLLRTQNFGKHDDPNDNSVVVRVEYGDTCLLFVGDMEGVAETELIEDPDLAPLLDCEFLKVGHHGSSTSSSPAFLAAVTPDVAAVSCGKRGVSTNARYKHPRHETLVSLLAHVRPRAPDDAADAEAYDSDDEKWRRVSLTGEVYVTASEGDLRFVSDGVSVQRAP